MPFYEPGLHELVRRARQDGRLSFATPSDADDELRTADLAIIAVGTHDGNGGWQTTTVRRALEQILPKLPAQAVLAIRSTLPPDFIRQLPAFLDEVRPDNDRPAVVLNPEFTREGTAISDFLGPERVVVGVVSDPTNRGVEMLRELYAQVSAPVLVMPAIDAALAKLGANLFLATKISFANELAALCTAFGADVTEVLHSMSLDSRIGRRFLRPGVGFGGSCLPNQVAMTVRSAEMIGHSMPLLDAVERVNIGQRTRFVDMIAAAVGELDGARVTLLGLTFKPNTDDVRDAPALTIASNLIARGATVVAYDPMPTARQAAAALIPGLHVTDSVEEAVAGADAVALTTEWPQFSELDWQAVGNAVAHRVVIDGRNALQPEALAAAGFRYFGIGRRGDSTDAPRDLVALSINAPPTSGLPAATAQVGDEVRG